VVELGIYHSLAAGCLAVEGHKRGRATRALPGVPEVRLAAAAKYERETRAIRDGDWLFMTRKHQLHPPLFSSSILTQNIQSYQPHSISLASIPHHPQRHPLTCVSHDPLAHSHALTYHMSIVHHFQLLKLAVVISSVLLLWWPFIRTGIISMNMTNMTRELVIDPLRYQCCINKSCSKCKAQIESKQINRKLRVPASFIKLFGAGD
jgi:hypothetical protein